MTVREFDNLISAAKQGKKIIRTIKYIDINHGHPKETVLHTENVNFLEVQMDEIVNSGVFRVSSRDQLVGQVTVFSIDESADSNECPSWCDYNDNGECTYCGTDPNECPKS